MAPKESLDTPAKSQINIQKHVQGYTWLEFLNSGFHDM